MNFSKWHILFTGNTEETVLERAEAEAEAKYGEGAFPMNIRYNGNWSASSLLLYFSMLGWVEKLSVTADVFKQRDTQ